MERAAAPAEPRLFTVRVPDGRMVVDFIADTLGRAAGGDPAQPGVTNQWALLAEAVSVMLAEADRMKERAAARAGTPEAAKFQTARKNYLAGAAKLLRYYQVAAGDVFDSTAGALTNTSGLPDWLLPGGIQLREVSGAARLNTDSGEFSGRLSGQLALSAFGATLTVPNASFDSRGRFDLSAYGSVTFPGGRLDVPPRQPLHLRSTPERPLALAGGARLTLANGLRLDASLSLVDPQYCFSLAARGLEFDLGKQLLLRRIVIQNQALENLGAEGLAALGDYLRSLNGAAETLLAAATNFPPVDEAGFGRPPEFAPPEITFDFSTLNAWSAELIANTRAGLLNAQQSLQPVLDSLARLNADARAATNSLTDERARLANLAARLALRRQMQAASALAAQQQAVAATELTQLQAKLVEGARQEGHNVIALVTPDLPDRLGESLEVVKLLLATEATLQSLDVSTPAGSLPSDPCQACLNPAANFVQRAEALSLCAARRQMARFGLNAVSGTITNPNVFNALAEIELYRAGRLLSTVEADFSEGGFDVSGQFVVFLEPILNRQRALLLEEAGPIASLPRLFEIVMLLTDNISDSDEANVFVDATALVAQLEAAAAPHLQGVAGGTLDAARAEAARNLANRRRQISGDVDQILGRYRSVGVIQPGDRYQPDFFTQLDQFFRILGRPVPPVIGTSMDEFVRFKVQELRARPFTVEFLTNRLSDGLDTANLIIGLTDWADTRMTNDFNVLTNLQFTITNFSLTFSAAAEGQRAWWLLDRYQEALRLHTAAYGSNLNSGLRLAEQKARAGSLAASTRVAGADQSQRHALDSPAPANGGGGRQQRGLEAGWFSESRQCVAPLAAAAAGRRRANVRFPDEHHVQFRDERGCQRSRPHALHPVGRLAGHV